MDRKRKRELRELNARAWAGEKDVFTIQSSLDTSVKKHTAFIKRIRTSITSATASTCLQEIRSLSLHKYLSEIVSASYEGLCKLKTPVEISAGVEIVSGLHQRFGPEEYTCYLGWLVGRGLVTPDKTALKNLSSEAREKEEKERLARQRVLLKVVTELWLVGLLRSLEDAVRPEDATGPKAKESTVPITSRNGDSTKAKLANGPAKSIDTEAFPLEVMKDLLGHDRDHLNLPLAVLFVKSFAWDILGIGSTTEKVRQEVGADGAIVPDDSLSDDEPQQNESVEAVDDPPLSSPELQQRFKGVLNRYLDDVKQHIVREHQAVAAQAKKNAEIYVKSGEVFEDRQAKFEKQQKALEKLTSNAQVLCEYLGSEMPDLNQKEEAETSAGGIGLIKTGEYLRGQGDGSGIWEDEDERRFYENLVDLKDRVPFVLLEEPKKKKQELDEQVGRKVDSESTNNQTSGTHTSPEASDEHSMAIANKSVGAQVDAIVARLPELQTKDAVDQIAVDFCFVNSKASRNRLIKAIEDVPKSRSDLFPLYARLAATLGRYLSDVTHSLVSYLDEEFRSLQRRKQKDFLGQVRTGNIRYLAELTKFGVVPEHVIFHCLKVSLDDFSRMNIEIIANLMENCGRFLFRNPETSPRMRSFLDTVQRKKTAHHLGAQERMLLENAMYYVNPPERAAIEQKERTPVELFVRKLVYVDMNKRTYTKILKSIRKLHWEEQEVMDMLKKIFSQPGKVKYSNIHLLAILVGALYRYHQDFVVSVLDNLMESITLGLELNEFKYNQRRLAEVKYLGELYNYKMVDSPVVFGTLYRIIGLGCLNGTPLPGHYNLLDTPDDFFRVRLVCNVLDTCGTCFDRGASKKKLDFFLTFFQYYIRTKERMPMDIDFIVQDTFALVRPAWEFAPDLEKAGQRFAEACAEAYKANEGDRAVEPDEPEDDVSSDGIDFDELPVPEDEEGRLSSADEADAGADQSEEHLRDSDDEEAIVVTMQREEHDPEADADFDSQLAKLMAESTEGRKVERKPVFDVPLPARRMVKEGGHVTEDASQETLSPTPNTMEFSLMTKKGSRPQTRSIALPSDSTFAIAMKTKKDAERAEQQRIKSLVLNYDLQDGDQDGIDQFSNYALQRNPNHPPRPRFIDTTVEAHDLPQGYGGERHEHNPSLRQTVHHASSKSTDKSGSHRGPQRARKLQLSDVDWT